MLYFEGFFSFLYLFSIFFLFYVFCYLLHESTCCRPDPEPLAYFQVIHEKIRNLAEKNPSMSIKSSLRPEPEPLAYFQVTPEKIRNLGTQNPSLNESSSEVKPNCL